MGREPLAAFLFLQDHYFQLILKVFFILPRGLRKRKANNHAVIHQLDTFLFPEFHDQVRVPLLHIFLPHHRSGSCPGHACAGATCPGASLIPSDKTSRTPGRSNRKTCNRRHRFPTKRSPFCSCGHRHPELRLYHFGGMGSFYRTKQPALFRGIFSRSKISSS